MCWSLCYIAVLAVLPMIALQGAPAFAQESGNGLSITPTKAEFNIEKGKAESVSIQVKNLTKGKVIAKAFINDFEADADTGNPKLIIDRSSEVSSSSLASFILGLEDVKLGPEETKEVQLTIQVPEKAVSGAYYGAIRFTSVPDTDVKNDAQVSLNASVATILLVEVPGAITQKIEVNDVNVYNSAGKAGSVFTAVPKQVGVQVKNVGNGFAKPFGKVLVKNMSGKQVYSYELNDSVPRGNVLPNTSRTFKNDISGIKLPGRYTVEANVSFAQGETLQANTTFWYLPTWFLVVLAVFVIALAAAAFYLYRRYISRSVSRRK
jgi:hypothetical protein